MSFLKKSVLQSLMIVMLLLLLPLLLLFGLCWCCVFYKIFYISNCFFIDTIWNMVKASWYDIKPDFTRKSFFRRICRKITLFLFNPIVLYFATKKAYIFVNDSVLSFFALQWAKLICFVTLRVLIVRKRLKKNKFLSFPRYLI